MDNYLSRGKLDNQIAIVMHSVTLERNIVQISSAFQHLKFSDFQMLSIHNTRS